MGGIRIGITKMPIHNTQVHPSDRFQSVKEKKHFHPDHTHKSPAECPMHQRERFAFLNDD